MVFMFVWNAPVGLRWVRGPGVVGHAWCVHPADVRRRRGAATRMVMAEKPPRAAAVPAQRPLPPPPRRPQLIWCNAPWRIWSARMAGSVGMSPAVRTAALVAGGRGRLAAAVAGGVAAVAASRLTSDSQKEARKKIIRIIQERGLTSAQEVRADVDKLQRESGMDAEAFAELRKSIYSLYFKAMVYATKGATKASEVGELLRLKSALGLDGTQVGNAHYEASRDFYRENVVWLESEEDDDNVRAARDGLDKILFLSDRVFAKDGEEAYRYENARVWKFFNITEAAAKARIVGVALPFYRKTVEKAIKDPKITAEDLRSLQDALGMTDDDTRTVKRDAYQAQLQICVNEKGFFDESDQQKFVRLRDLLSVSEETARDFLVRFTSPVYAEAVRLALTDVQSSDPEASNATKIYGRLALRQSELLLGREEARNILYSHIRDDIIGKLQETRKNLRLNNMSGTVSSLKDALAHTENIVRLVRATMGSEDADPMAALRLYMGDVSEELGRQEPKQMYRVFLGECLSDRNVDEGEAKQLNLLRNVLNLTEDDAAEAYRVTTGPLYRKEAALKLQEGQELTDSAKADLRKLLTSLSVPEQTVKQINGDLYRERLLKFADGNRILSELDAAQLAKLRDFLDLTLADVTDTHAKVCAPIYEQAVNEAMGSSGIILEEYQAALARLRERLCLTEDAGKQIFYQVAKGRLFNFAQRAVKVMQARQTIRGATEERDVGDDPFVNRAGAQLGIEGSGLTIELYAMVEFYVRNKILIEETEEYEVEEMVEVPESSEESATSAMTGASKEGTTADEGAGSEATAAEEAGQAKKEPKMELRKVKKTRKSYKYPVDLRGAFEPKLVQELYRQYSIQCFATKASTQEQSRLYAEKSKLAPILGLTPVEQKEVDQSIGRPILNNFLGQILQQGPITDQILQAIKPIQQETGLTDKEFNDMILEAKMGRVMVLVERCFASPRVLPEMVRKVRETAAQNGVDMVKDLKVSADQRGKLFAVEVDDAIENGRITPTDQSALSTAQNGFSIDEQQAQDILLECIQRRCSGLMTDAAGALRQDRLETAVDDIIKMLRFGRLLPAKVDNKVVSMKEKQELVLVYQSYAIREGAMSQSEKESLELLKLMMGAE
ncbi:Transmembrane protein [Porphyridium purpureum]|uniref:Transmembrane protein n=1 Tax=Porphyridium purpureum TaxID=35688 RepID=A0A5J4YYA6_PORPP|nr:Transmembrane protein [Porphyridium purpureum]|eukprot:POR6742..scf209_3